MALPALTMDISTLARMHADTLSASACEQIAAFCDSVVSLNHSYDGMSAAEVEKFKIVGAGLRALLAMQSD